MHHPFCRQHQQAIAVAVHAVELDVPDSEGAPLGRSPLALCISHAMLLVSREKGQGRPDQPVGPPFALLEDASVASASLLSEDPVIQIGGYEHRLSVVDFELHSVYADGEVETVIVAYPPLRFRVDFRAVRDAAVVRVARWEAVEEGFRGVLDPALRGEAVALERSSSKAEDPCASPDPRLTDVSLVEGVVRDLLPVGFAETDWLVAVGWVGSCDEEARSNEDGWRAVRGGLGECVRDDARAPADVAAADDAFEEPLTSDDIGE